MTNKVSLLKWILELVLFVCLSSVTQAADFRSGDTIEVNGPQSDLLFLSGSNVRSSVQSSNDIFMAGGNLNQSGGGAENLFAAGGNIDLINSKIHLGVVTGGNITISQIQTGDLISAGGRVRVDQSQIQNNAILAGGQIDIGQGTVIRNSTILGGRDIFFAGQAQGDVEIAGNEVHLSGDFAKNVRVRAQHLVVGPDTRIAGNFSHAVDRLEVSPNAQILGRNEVLPVSETPMTGPAKTAAVLSGLLFLFGLLLAPTVVATVFPRFVQNGNNHIRLHFWENVGKGTVALIVAPLVLVLLFMSMVGVPIALFALPFFIVATLMAWSIALFAVGNQLRFWISRGRRMSPDPTASLSRGQVFGWTLLGALIMMLVLLIPFVGMIFSLILFLAGLGSIYSQMRGAPRARAAEEISQRPSGFVPAGSHG